MVLKANEPSSVYLYGDCPLTLTRKVTWEAAIYCSIRSSPLQLYPSHTTTDRSPEMRESALKENCMKARQHRGSGTRHSH